MRGTARVPFVGHAAHFYMHVVPAQPLLALQPPARRSSRRERPGHLGYALVLKRHGNLPSAFPPFMPNSLRLEIGNRPCTGFFSGLPAGSRPPRASGTGTGNRYPFGTPPSSCQPPLSPRLLCRGTIAAGSAGAVKVGKAAKVYFRGLPLITRALCILEPMPQPVQSRREARPRLGRDPSPPSLGTLDIYFPRHSHG